MSKNTTLIVTSTPDPDQIGALEQYVQGVMPLLKRVGGVVLKRSTITDTFFGEQSFSTLLVMDFPSKQLLLEMFHSDAYQRLLPARDKAFRKIDIFFADDLPKTPPTP